ncbi:unnamed protein product [Polarella glacialis]|uniref:Uncharacterized protein n=1 Tax=Polarella glacialis TaxID=89957 RepID=A0A813LYP4_POLGL|nr:unnamed protein product [Polarella glacialis]
MFADSVEEPAETVQRSLFSDDLASEASPTRDFKADTASIPSIEAKEPATAADSAPASAPSANPVALTSGQRTVADMFGDDSNEDPASDGSFSNLSIPSLPMDGYKSPRPAAGDAASVASPAPVLAASPAAPVGGAASPASSQRSHDSRRLGGSGSGSISSVPSLPMEAPQSPGSGRSGGSGRVAEGSIASAGSASAVSRSGSRQAVDQKEEVLAGLEKSVESPGAEEGREAADARVSEKPEEPASASVGDRFQAAIAARLEKARIEKETAAPVQEAQQAAAAEPMDDEEDSANNMSGHESFADSRGSGASDAWA